MLFQLFIIFISCNIQRVFSIPSFDIWTSSFLSPLISKGLKGEQALKLAELAQKRQEIGEKQAIQRIKLTKKEFRR